MVREPAGHRETIGSRRTSDSPPTKVLAGPETDDPSELERRTDEALTLVSSIDLHGW